MEEKGQQIPRMRHIYRNAKEAIIWLSEGNESSDRVMPQLKHLGGDAFRAGFMSLDSEDVQRRPNVEREKRQIKKNVERLITKLAKEYGDNGPFAIGDLIELSYRTGSEGCGFSKRCQWRASSSLCAGINGPQACSFVWGLFSSSFG